MVPVAGRLNGLGISITMSGLIFQPSWKVSGAGLSFASPSVAPWSAQETKVLMSAWLSRRSLAKWPYCGSANQGGIFWLTTATFIAFAQGRASLYVSSDIGATSPGRWQPWQFFCKIGSTSRLNVTEAGALEAAAAAIAMTEPARDTRSVLTLRPSWASLHCEAIIAKAWSKHKG